jgi:hypothetical protein
MLEFFLVFVNLDQQNVKFISDAFHNPYSFVVLCFAFLGLIYVIFPIVSGERKLRGTLLQTISILPRRNLRIAILIASVLAIALVALLVD